MPSYRQCLTPRSVDQQYQLLLYILCFCRPLMCGSVCYCCINVHILYVSAFILCRRLLGVHFWSIVGGKGFSVLIATHRISAEPYLQFALVNWAARKDMMEDNKKRRLNQQKQTAVSMVANHTNAMDVIHRSYI